MADERQFVTKAELREELKLFKAELKAEFKAEWTADLAATEQRLEGRMDTLEQRMIDTVREMLHDTETRLLKAFYGWADGANQHFKQIDSNEASLNTRVTSLENRLFEVEKRLLNQPPAA